VRLYDQIEADRRTSRRFMRTVERRSALDHPHLLEIYGAGVWEGCLVMATGPQSIPSLGYRLKEGPLTPGEMIEILSEAASAIDHAAEAGILNREIGVGSILLDPERGVQLGDLGLWVPFVEDLAPWAHPYPAHISPETARGESLVRASTVYSLASVMFDCLTGAPPFHGHVMKVVEAHANGRPPRPTDRDPGLGPDIDRVFETAMAKAAEDRYQTATEMVQAASGALGVAPVTKRPTARPRPAAEPVVPEPRQERPERRLRHERRQRERRRRTRRTRVTAAAVTVAVVGALAAGGYLLGTAGDDDGGSASRPAPQPAASAARGLNAELRRMDGEVVAGRARLATARTPAGQAGAATALAEEYRVTGRTVGAITPRAGLDLPGVSSRLLGAGDAYAGLARAARSGDRGAFAAARREVRAAEAALRRDLANL
jgi:hypothetical protein